MNLYSVTQTYWLEGTNQEEQYVTVTIAATSHEDAEVKACLMGLFDSYYDYDIDEIGISDVYETEELASLTEEETKQILEKEKEYKGILELYQIGCDKGESEYPLLRQYYNNPNIQIHGDVGSSDIVFYTVEHKLCPNIKLQFDENEELDQIWVNDDWGGNDLSDIKDIVDEAADSYISYLEDIVEEKNMNLDL